MKTCLYKPVFVNPQAYFVFPQLYDMQPKTDNFVEQAIFTGRLIITDLTNNQYTSYQNVNTIDFSQYADKHIKIEQYTDTGAVVLGEWIMSQDTTEVKPIASYRAYDKTNDDEDRSVLTDLTGNGHDIQLYNFAFAESSGYGKYANDFNNWNKNTIADSIVKSNKIEIKSVKETYLNFIETIKKSVISKMKIEVTGLPSNVVLRYTYGSEEDTSANKVINIKANGIYELPASYAIYSGFSISKILESCNITIEQIPDYQGALVSDGVDDYGLCKNFPILTKEKGYTIFAIRKQINLGNTNRVFLSNAVNANTGAFQMETFLFAENFQYRTYTFGSLNAMSSYKDLFAYQTSSNYSGIKDLFVGNNTVGTNKIILFASGYLSWNASIALYALEIYDRDLTDEEIAKVKARMIAEYEEKTGNKYEEETV